MHAACVALWRGRARFLVLWTIIHNYSPRKPNETPFLTAAAVVSLSLSAGSLQSLNIMSLALAYASCPGPRI